MNTSAYEAAGAGAVWRDMNHFGRVRVSGRDAATLLHHLSTNDVKALREGDCCDSVLVSSRARVLDWLTIARDANGFLVITSPNRRETFVPHARKFVLFRQDVTLRDETEDASQSLCAVFGARLPESLLERGHAVGVAVAPTRRLPFNGVWMWGARDSLRAFVGGLQLPECDGETFNVLRVESGTPVVGAELSEDVNPWEARLDASISLAKGCYNGQEIVARLNTYQKVKQRLTGLQLDAPLSLPFGERLSLQRDNREAGFVTSVVESPSGHLALGFVRGELDAVETLDCVRDGKIVARAQVSPRAFESAPTKSNAVKPPSKLPAMNRPARGFGGRGIL